MAEGDGGESGEEVGVFGLVPVGRKLIRGTDQEGVPFDAEGVGGLEPRAVRLLREHLPGALAQAIPGFGRR